jgi:hypothetical protein
MRKKVLLSLDETQLARLDAAASAAGKTRSAWIAGLVDDALQHQVDDRIRRSQEAIARIREIFAANGPHEPFDAVTEIRAMREERMDQIERAIEGRRTERHTTVRP